MSWRERLTPMLLPPHPGGSFSGPLYTSNDGALHCYGFAGKRVISSQFGYSIKAAGSVSTPNKISYSGYMGFSGGSYNIWLDPTYGWVASTLAIGTALLEYFQPTDPSVSTTVGSYAGDAFYTIGSASGSGSLPSLGGSLTAYGRGSLRGSTYGGTSSSSIAVTTSWDYWQLSTGTYGKFAPQNSASGYKYFGVPQWKKGETLYTRSISLDAHSKHSYGSISWVETATKDGEPVTVQKFVLGTWGSDDGWNEASSAPSAESSWTLSFAKNEDSEAEGENATLSWNAWVLGEETMEIYSINASIWRVTQ